MLKTAHLKLDPLIYYQILGLPSAVCHSNDSHSSLSWSLHEKVRQTGIIYISLI